MALYLTIRNTTGTYDKADYWFKLERNDQKVAEGQVFNFRRASGYAALLFQIAKCLAEGDNPGPEDKPDDT